MIKKGLCRTLILDYIEKHNLDTNEKIMDKLADIFKMLKDYNKDGKDVDVIPKDMQYKDFVAIAKQEYVKAKMFKSMGIKIM